MSYFAAVLLAFLIWLGIFASMKTLRKDMLQAGLLFCWFVVIDYFSTPSYWFPKTFNNLPVGIEAFLVTFFMAGIAVSLATLVTDRKYTHTGVDLTKGVILLVPSVISLLVAFHFHLAFM